VQAPDCILEFKYGLMQLVPTVDLRANAAADIQWFLQDSNAVSGRGGEELSVEPNWSYQPLFAETMGRKC